MTFKSHLFVALFVALNIGGCNADDQHFATSDPEKSSSSEPVPSLPVTPHSSPEEVVLAYLYADLDSGLVGSSELANTLLVAEDRDFLRHETRAGRTKRVRLPPAIIAALKRLVSFHVTATSVENDSANVTLEMLGPDMDMPTLSSLMEGDRSPGLEEEVLAYLNTPNLEVRRYNFSRRLVKEPQGWRVFLGVANADKARKLVAEAEQIVPHDDMLRPYEGAVLEEMKPKLLAAETKYIEAISLSGEQSMAGINLHFLRRQLSKLELYNTYKTRVRIINVGATQQEDGGAKVAGEIKNASDTIFTRVGISIYFLDKDGNAVHEEKYAPVYKAVSSYGQRDSGPLKPNYGRKFTYTIKPDRIPSDWSGKIEVSISDLGLD